MCYSIPVNLLLNFNFFVTKNQIKLDSFARRHLGPDDHQVTIMLEKLGLDSIDQLVEQVIPSSIRFDQKLNLPDALSESDYSQLMLDLSKKNKNFRNFIGLGYHPTYLPAVIQRNIFENPGWYTAYTPYQSEISQGRLEALLNFQTMVIDLTQMEVANASLLDEATSAAEAMRLLFATRSPKKKKNNARRFLVPSNVFPQTLKVLKTRANPIDIEIIIGHHESVSLDQSYFGAIIQYPGKRGEIPNLSAFVEKAKAFDIPTVVAADLLSLAILEPPGTHGVDVVVGTTQRFGIPLGYGGPHAAYFSTLEKYKRYIPGRIIGLSKDRSGKPAYRMALQTREQHIKRDRATSNICTSQVLLAVMASMYGVFHGPKGPLSISNKIHQKALQLSQKLNSLGYQQLNESLFDTLQIRADAEKIKSVAENHQINFWYVDQQTVCISINEITTDQDIDDIAEVFEFAKGQISGSDLNFIGGIPKNTIRTSNFMQHPVFNQYHSETSLMRYIKSLENKDLSLTTSMIALGSCTMKLNAAVQLLPLSKSSWNALHPFAPKNQVLGYQKVLHELENYLSEITGFYATSLQPNSGAQGEYAGLLAIKAYLKSKGDFHRNVCLIPESSHGTNAASAIMAGMKVVVVTSDNQGEIDWHDFQSKADLHKEKLAAIMITYPSTHGVFGSNIKKVTQLIHRYGGQVYMDGANMNAQVGLTNPAIIGADVCHLNLHKTFAIPHGGGGPGVGPICVAQHLAPFLPDTSIESSEKDLSDPIHISAAPYGSPLVSLISYGYVRLLGKQYLKRCSEIALLNANYIQYRLKDYYPIVFTGDQNRVGHELIIDCRQFVKFQIDASDIAKRLMDYGFHCPTLSFPIRGTLMIEPTESENLSEIDRFCDALISIHAEINSTDESNRQLLKNAPHTIELVSSDNWDFPYSRTRAAFPNGKKSKKYWPPIQRIDDAYGDRNLICTCPPTEAFDDFS